MRLCISILLCGLCLAGCAGRSDDARIKAAIEAMRVAVQEHRPRDFMANVSDDFAGNEGSVDHAALFNLLRVQALRNDHIGILLGPISIDWQGDRATTHFTAAIAGGNSAVLPEHAEVYAITAAWKKNGSSWRCYNATWSSDSR